MRSPWWLIVSCIFFAATLVWADGDLPTRLMNNSEAAAFKQVQSVIRSALPAATDGVIVTYVGFDRKDIVENATPLRMSPLLFKASYALTGDKRKSSMEAMQMDLIKGNPDQQARMAELEARSEELKQARKRVKTKEEKEQVRAELNKIHVEERVLREQIASGSTAGWNKGMQTVDTSLPPKELTVLVWVNQAVYVPDSARPYQVGGAARAFEQDERCQEGSYCITLLLGRFDSEKRISGFTRYTLRDSSNAVPTKARGMAVTVGGPKEKMKYLQQFVKQINTSRLQVLLQ